MAHQLSHPIPLDRRQSPTPRIDVHTDSDNRKYDHDLPQGHLSRQLSNEAYAELEIAERAAAPSPVDIGPPPDGGLRAWAVICSSSLVLFCVWGFVTSMGQLQAYYLAHQLSDYSKATVAWISSLQGTLTYIGSLFVGRYFDAHGPRQLIWTGTLLLTSSLVAVAFCHAYYQFFLAHMLFGLGGTIVYSPSTAISAHWFAKRRGTAVGVIVTGAGAGGIVYPILLKNLFDQLSFRNTMLITAAFTFALMLPACAFMQARLPPRRAPPLKSLAKPWHEVRYACLVIGVAIMLVNMFTPYFNAPIFAESNHASPAVTEYAVAILQAGSFVGRAASGPLADSYGVWNVFGTVGFSSSLVIFALWTGAPGVGSTIAGFILFGIVSGAWMTLVTAATAAISPVTEVGMRIGMLWTVGAIPNLVGPVISGVLISAAGGKFTYAAVFTGSTVLIGAAVVVAPPLLAFVRGGCSKL